MGLVRQIAEEALRLTYSDIPEKDRHQVKRLLLDTTACAYGGRDSESVEALLRAIPLLGGPEEARILTRRTPASVLNAILVNGAMVRFLDMNDVQMPRHGHNSEVIPVVQALCERQATSGQDFILGVWLGYELATRFTECITGRHLEQRGWNLDMRAAFVVPIVAGRLLGLDSRQIENAVGITLSRGLLLEVIDHPAETNSMSKNVRFPLTAHLGVLATYLAGEGFTGPERALEGGDGFIETVLHGEFDVEHLQTAGFRSLVHNVAMKRFAACFATHGHLAATLELVLEHDLAPAEIERVDIRTTTRGAKHTGDPARRYPTNKETADHSSYYVQAAIIVDREVGPQQYSPEKLADPEIRRLASAVTIAGDPEFDPVYPSAHVSIRLLGGTTLEKRVEEPAGHPSNPLSDQSIEAKFAALAHPYLEAAQIDQACGAIWNIDQYQDIRDFTLDVSGLVP